MSGADSEAPEKQALREKFQILETSSFQALLDSQVMSSSGKTLSSGTPPPGTELALQGRGCGLPPHPQMHRKHGLLQPPKWAKPGVSLRRGAFSVRGGGSEEPGGSKAPPTCTFSPTWKFSLSLPFSLLPVLNLAALLQGAGSDRPEALSTCHLVLISVHHQF